MMNIKTVVTVEDTSNRCNLYTLFVHASQGDFKETIDSGDKDKINDLENTIKKEFDVFANRYFNEGRDYEKSIK